MGFEKIDSNKVFQGKAFDVRQDVIRLPNARTTRLDIVEHVGAVTILPLDQDGLIWFVRQYRHPAGMRILELPAGTLEVGEAPLVCAHREIQEEIGMKAAKMEKLGEFFLAPGYSTEFMHIYLATELTPSRLPGDEDEFIEIEKYTSRAVLHLISTGQIQDGKTLAAFFLGRHIFA